MTTPAPVRPGRGLDPLILLAALLAIGCGVAWFMARRAPRRVLGAARSPSSLAIDAQGAVAGDDPRLSNFESALKELRAAAAANAEAPFAKDPRYPSVVSNAGTVLQARGCPRRRRRSPRVRRGTSFRSSWPKSVRLPVASPARISKPRPDRSNVSKCGRSACSSTLQRSPRARRIRARLRSAWRRARTTSARSSRDSRARIPASACRRPTGPQAPVACRPSTRSIRISVPRFAAP